MKRAGFAFLLLAIVASLLVLPARSYLNGVTRPSSGGNPEIDRWDFGAFPVQWSLNPSRQSNISGSRSLAAMMEASYATWRNAPNVTIGITRGPDTTQTQEGFNQDSANNINLICFVCGADFSEQPEALAVAITTVSNRAGEPDGHGGTSKFVGQILDSDILFNPKKDFSTGGGSGQDVQTVATHEIGHQLGLDHSAIVRAVMFPFAPDLLTTLAWDDVAGLAVIYPKSSPDVATGAISGSVSLTGSGGVFGAHVYAEPVGAAGGYGSSIRPSPVGNLTRADGSYTIQGLPGGSYIVVAEPLDEPVTNENVGNYAPPFGRSSVQTNFKTRWY
jgi:hypothetical protein